MSERLWGLAAPKGVNLDAISRGMPEMTPADLAIACKGLPRLPFAAALYSFAGDDSVWPTLRTGLLEYLLAERERQQWAQRVERISGEKTRFAEELVSLFLADERRPAVFQASPELRARCLSVESDVWRRVVSHQYAAIQAEFTRWLLDAAEHVSRRMRAA